MANRFLNNIRINDEYTLPSTDGSADQVITTDGAGNLSFIDVNSVIDTATDQVYYTVKNSTGSTLAKGKAVMAVGTDGNSGHILVDEMIADGSIEPKYFVGILAESIGNGNTGKAIHFGEIDQFNTTGQNGETWNDAQILWCDPDNPGDYTITEPDGPNVKIAAAIILKASTNGKIRVRVQGNEGIHDLHDTKITSQVDGDVLVWDNTTGVWFNDSTLNVDYTNGRVGIGTTSPAAKLHTAGEGIVNIVQSSNTVSYTQYYTSSTGANFVYDGLTVGLNGLNGYVLLREAANLILGTSDTERMRITSDGNVGIGTTSPSADLHVNSSNNLGFTLQHASRPTISLTDGTNYGYIGLESGGAIITGTSDNDISIRSPRDVVFGGGPIARMTIKNDGNVGIGTPSPNQKLEVAGRVRISTDPTVELYNTSANRGGVQWVDGSLMTKIFSGGSSGAGAGIIFETNTTEKMRIDSLGNVGIGTTSPTVALDFGATVNKAFHLYTSGADIYGFNMKQYDGNGYGVNILSGNNGYIKLRTASGTTTQTTRLTVTPGGNIGIGTTNPIYKLDVNGVINVSDNNPIRSGNEIMIRRTDSTNLLRIGSGDANDETQFYAGGAERMRIASSGNVGIGTTSPGYKLDVAGELGAANTFTLAADGSSNYTASRIRLLSHDNYRGAGTFFGGVDSTWFMGTPYTDFSGGFIIARKSSAATYEDTAQYSNALFTVKSSGNVGIGTTSPSSKLQVVGNVRGGSFGVQEDSVNPSNNTMTRVTSPAGATYDDQNNTASTGIISVILPVTGSDTMLSFTIRVFDYAQNESFDVHIAGYWYSGDNWTNMSTRIESEGGVDRNFNIRFGKVTATNRGWVGIGEDYTQWSYLKFSVINFQAAHINDSFENWGDGWDTAVLTSIDDYTLATTRANSQVNNWKRNGANLYYGGSSGNVGIGTTSPGTKLHINTGGTYESESLVGSIFIEPTGVTYNGYGAGIVLGAGRGGLVSGGAAIASVLDSASDPDSSGLSFFYHNSIFADPRTEGMRLTADGNVGIGTTSPDQKLHVSGNARVTGAYYDSNNSPGTSGQVLSSTATGTDWVSLSEISGVDGTGTAGYVAKWSDADTITDSIIYDNGTNVGIGTPSPGSRLTVAGEGSGSVRMGNTGFGGDWVGISLSGNLNTTDYNLLGSQSNTSFYLNRPNGGDMLFRHNNVDQMIIKSSGNVGIGTTNPTSTLHLSKAGGTLIKLGTSQNTSEIEARESGSANLLVFSSNNSVDHMVIEDGGNVGIGTTSPGAKLDVFDQSTIATNTIVAQAIKNYAGGSAMFRVGLNAGNTTADIEMNSGAAGPFRYGSYGEMNIVNNRSSSKINFVNNASIAATIDSAGNVGIGTTSPSTKLEVAGTLKATGEVTLSNYSDGGLSVNSSGVVRVEPSYQNISLGESYAANLREYYYRNGYTVSPTDTGYQYAKLIDQGLLNKASLVLIPQAQKEGLLAVNKPNGTDFTFTRASAATRVNSEGLIEKETQNLLLQSNSFTSWSQSTEASSTSGQSGYDGSLDAWLVTKSAANGSIREFYTFNGSVTTFSVYAKAGTTNWMELFAGGNGVFFDLANGIIGSSSGTIIDSNIESVGSGWYRCSIVQNYNGVSTLRIYVSNADGDNSGTSGSIYIQDAQLNQGLVADSYLETTTAAVYEGITDNIPRLDYTDASCPSLKLEPQRTNLMPCSEYNSSVFGLGPNITFDGYVESPEGLNNGARFTSIAFGNAYILVPNVTIPTGKFTFSMYVRGVSGSFTNTQLYIPSFTGSRPTMNETPIAGEDWKRVYGTGENTGSSVTRTITLPFYDQPVGAVWEMYGFQLEGGGAEYPTSYIPTYGASVTRVFDTGVITSATDLIGQTEGTLYFEGFAIASESTNKRISLSDGTNANRVTLSFNLNAITFIVISNNVASLSTTITSSPDTNHKIALAYKENDFVAYLDGTQVVTDSSGATFSGALNSFRFSDGQSGLSPFAGDIKQALLFKTRLSNEELAALTTL